MSLHPSSVIFLVATVAYLGIRAVFKRRMAGATVASSRSSPGDMALVALVVAGQIVLPLASIFTPWLDGAAYPATSSLRHWIGAATMAGGVWLFWHAHADLGTNWSVTLEVQQTHQLVVDGVYRHLRHPMYAAFLVMAIGQALLVSNWIAGPAALVAVTLMCVVRTPKEEAMLIEQFGDAYRDYMHSTGGIVPKVRGLT